MKSAGFVIPVYNPATGWQGRLAEELRAACRGLSVQVVVVDDASLRPVAVETLRAGLPGARVELVRFERNRGKGAAVRAGLERLALADYYFYTDSDFPYRPQDAAAMMRAIDAGADVAPGMRDGTYFAGIPPMRRLISKALSALVKTAIRIPFTDTQCGLKCFNEKGRELLLKTRVERFLFDVEFIYLAYHTPDVKVSPVSATLRPGITVSNVGGALLLREFGNFLQILYRIYFRGW